MSKASIKQYLFLFQVYRLINYVHICKKIRLKKYLTILLFAITTTVFTQTVRKYSNEFLNIGVDAAALGMSSAVTSQSADVNSGYWNPAGLLNLEDNQLALMHSGYFANIANYDYAGFAMPLDDRSAVGISLIRFAVDDILKLPVQGLNYGVNAKVIRRIIGDFASSWGFGLDLGLQFESKNNWKFGVMARDITTTFNAWSINKDEFAKVQNAIAGQNQELPETTEITIPKLQIGISKKMIFNDDYSLVTAVNLNVRFEENNDVFSSSFASINPALGFEFGYINMIYLRTGVGNFQNELQIDNTNQLSFQPSFGVGFKYNGIQIDYAFTDIGDQSVALYSNVFSMTFDFSIFR